mgnify:CR=1 FL=1
MLRVPALSCKTAKNSTDICGTELVTEVQIILLSVDHTLMYIRLLPNLPYWIRFISTEVVRFRHYSHMWHRILSTDSNQGAMNSLYQEIGVRVCSFIGLNLTRYRTECLRQRIDLLCFRHWVQVSGGIHIRSWSSRYFHALWSTRKCVSASPINAYFAEASSSRKLKHLHNHHSIPLTCNAMGNTIMDQSCLNSSNGL